jgi:DNA-binding HxlR family transcriptional regulator
MAHPQVSVITRALLSNGTYYNWGYNAAGQLGQAFSGTRRFAEFETQLGISAQRLSERLAKLTADGIFEQRPYGDHPNRFEYRLTPMGRDLYSIVMALFRWGDVWLAGDSGPPIVFRHNCGADAQATMVCAECREALDPHHVTPELGPGLMS